MLIVVVGDADGMMVDEDTDGEITGAGTMLAISL